MTDDERLKADIIAELLRVNIDVGQTGVAVGHSDYEAAYGNLEAIAERITNLIPQIAKARKR